MQGAIRPTTIRDVNEPGQPSLMSRSKVVIGLLLAAVLFFYQLRHPVIRSTFLVVNDLLGSILALCLPWLTVIAVFRMGRMWSRAIALVAVIPLLVYTALVFIGASMWAVSVNASFERLSETPWQGSKICLYRTNGGAFTDYGVVIRQEKRLFPGLMMVRQLDDFYPCSLLDVMATERGVTLKNGEAMCPGLARSVREYRLKPYVYFGPQSRFVPGGNALAD